METREPDSDFVHWLRWFDPELRVLWNPQLRRWCIDELNKETKLWQRILIWQSDEKEALPLSRDLALRLQLMRTKYSALVQLGSDDYLNGLQDKCDFLNQERVEHARMDARHFIVDNIGSFRAALEAQRSDFSRNR